MTQPDDPPAIRPNYFLYRLTPPRPTFPGDMTDPEASIMGQHFAYWHTLEEKDLVVVYGPVLDPAGTWGLGIVQTDTTDDARVLAVNDPAVSSGLCSFELRPLQDPYVRG
jgi:uncharacterized protein YciI